MFKKGLKLYSIFKSKCPHCQEDDFFEGSRFKANVAEKCNVCGEKFSKEPGFYQGSYYVTYALGVAIFVAVWVASRVLFPEMSMPILATIIVSALLLMTPFSYYLSKIIWAIFFSVINHEQKMRELLLENYEHLFEIELLDEIKKEGYIKNIPEGDVIINIGDTVRNMPLLLEGAIKVSRLDDDGDELLLYYLEKGDVCAMTLTCCTGNSISEIRAVAEMDSKIIMVPVQKMADWVRDYETWRTFVFESYNSRFKEMLEAIDNLAFLNMHERVLKYLKHKVIVTKDTFLYVTHQTIAYDLHTSRVVISRILKSLEKEGKLKLDRNKIEFLDF